MLRKTVIRWSTLAVALAAAILVPYFVFGEQLEAWTAGFLDGSGAPPWVIAGVVVGLLAVDVLAPVPSSIVGTAAGYALGFGFGTLSAFAGLTVCCLVGYGIGAVVGRPATRHFVGPGEAERLERGAARWGDWMLVICRPVPVLAEASVVVAGVARKRFARFFLLTALANLGIAAAYAAVGALSASVNSFLLALAGSILLPLGAILAARRK